MTGTILPKEKNVFFYEELKNPFAKLWNQLLYHSVE